MTHTHEDRIAERDPCLCTAYGCPLLGTMTGSTSGANDWACLYHVNKPATQLQDITRAIRRHAWLAEAISSVRGMTPGNPNRGAILSRIWDQFNQHDHPELYWDRVETVRRWTNRLEKALDELVTPDLMPSAPPTMGKPEETWGSAGAALPLWA